MLVSVCAHLCKTVIKTRRAGECSVFGNSYAYRCVHLRTGLTACTFYFNSQPPVQSSCWEDGHVFEKDLPWNNWGMTSQENKLGMDNIKETFFFFFLLFWGLTELNLSPFCSSSSPEKCDCKICVHK